MSARTDLAFPLLGAVLAVAAVIAVAVAIPGIGFGSTAFLAGLVAAVLPLVIHLVGRRRATPHRFAAMEFLLRGERRVARRLRLRHLVLLALRTLATALVPLVLARPFAVGAREALPPQAADASTVVVVDASFSMQFVSSGRSLFERAKDRVLDLLRRQTASEDMAVIVARRKPVRLTAGLSADAELLRRAAVSLAPTFEAADVVAALADAEAILATSTRATRRVVLLSDFAGPELARAAAWRTADPNIAFHAIDVSLGQSLPNAAIVGVTVHPAFDVAPGTYRVAVSIANFVAEAARALRVSLKVGTGEMTGLVEVEPFARVTKEFHVEVAAGKVMTAAATIAGDALAADDAYPFVFSTFLGPRVLVVNGSPSTIAHRDEVFYLTRALRAATTERGPFQVTVVNIDEVFDPAAFDVVFLCNVGAFPQARVRDLESAVRAGTGLFVALGANVSGAAFRDGLDRLLPATAHTQQTRPPASPLTITLGSGATATTRAFGEASATGGARPGFTRSFLLLPKGGGGVETTLRFDDGTPALVEHAVGKGRVALFASTIDRDWTDLPIRPVFAAWVADVALALSQGAPSSRAPAVHPGDEIPTRRDVARTVTDPIGHVETRDANDARPILATRPGFHRVETGAAGHEVVSTVAVTIDPAESNTTKGGAPRGATPSHAATKGGGPDAPPGSPLATIFALFLLLALLTEGAVALRR